MSSIEQVLIAQPPVANRIGIRIHLSTMQFQVLHVYETQYYVSDVHCNESMKMTRNILIIEQYLLIVDIKMNFHLTNAITIFTIFLI